MPHRCAEDIAILETNSAIVTNASLFKIKMNVSDIIIWYMCVLKLCYACVNISLVSYYKLQLCTNL